MIMRYSCLIVEDELPAQKVLLNFIGKLDTLELKGVCKNALEASDFLIRERVDLMFLDINLPGFSGIEFLKSLTKAPKVIFTTAYAEFAVDGFDLEVVDYLIKPFAFEMYLLKLISIVFDCEKSSSMPQAYIFTIKILSSLIC